jgi:hypothetical protein
MEYDILLVALKKLLAAALACSALTGLGKAFNETVRKTVARLPEKASNAPLTVYAALGFICYLAALVACVFSAVFLLQFFML